MAEYPLETLCPSQATDTKLELTLGKCFWICLIGLTQALQFEVRVNSQNFATTGSRVCINTCLVVFYCVNFSRTGVLHSFRLNWTDLY